MPNRVLIVTVTDADRENLERMARDRGAPARVAERARIVLLSAEGLTGPQITEWLFDALGWYQRRPHLVGQHHFVMGEG